jgi:amino acid adenylation domain-containing protein
VSTQDLLDRLRALEVHVYAEDGRLRVSAPKGRVTPELQAALVASKEELLRVLSAPQRASDGPALASVARDGGASLPLSSLQERLWMLEELQPGQTAYNFASLLSPEGPVDAAQLEQAIRRVVARHEILRSRFVLEGDRPVARVGAPEDVPIEIRDLRAMPEAERQQLLATAADVAAHRPFDLATEAPVRFAILRTADDRLSLLVAAHHIALDAWSFGLLGRDLQAEYEAVGAGRPAAPAPALQYADFAHWQRAVLDHPSAETRLQYWKTRLAALPQLSTFPTDRARMLDGSADGTALRYRWPESLYAAVRATARETDATVYMVLVAAVTAVLARHSGQTDLAVGSPLGTRDRPELEAMIGPVVNPLVLRFDVADDPTFAQLVKRVRDQLLEGHTNQEVPFERIVQELNPQRSLGHSPLFQVAVVLHNANAEGSAPLVGGGSIYDLTVFGHEERGSLGGSIEYRTDLYDEATIRRIAEHLERLLAAAAANPQTRISALPLLSAEEERQVVSTFNASQVAVDRATVVEQFVRTAAARPDDVAVVAADGALTYRELDRRSAALAAHLRTLGAERGRFVALATDRTSALPVAALGILRAGAAYVPVDLSYPAERVALMLRDSGARQIVTSRAIVSSLGAAASEATVVVLDDLALDDATLDAAAAPGPDDVAYLIYTSGSTGVPKGVLVPHFAVSNFLGAMRERIGFGPEDGIVAITSASFDISVLELFLPVVQGGRTIVADRDTAADGARLAELVRTSGATMLQSTPSGWRLLMRANWEGSPTLTAIAGGEPMPQDLLEWLWARVGTVWNGYGPTETTVYSTAARLDRGDLITIGTPVANTQIYVLDAHRRPAPIGAPGEIYIAGDGVARGYHNRPELTAERFVPDPFAPGALHAPRSPLAESNDGVSGERGAWSVEGARMYRTGDAGRWRADGRLEHLGRLDGQVKVRGYRIETGEIETALTSHPLVKAAVVGVQALSADDPRIVAWVQMEEDEDVTPSELRRHVRQRLPEFMVPSMIVPVETIPLTPNGKVDRRALPDAFATTRPAPTVGAPPTTPTERLIAEIWRRLLRVEQVSVTDSFFELGGHSLLAMRAAGEISSRIGRAIDPRLLFFRTLGQLAEACDASPATPAAPAALAARRA